MTLLWSNIESFWTIEACMNEIIVLWNVVGVFFSASQAHSRFKSFVSFESMKNFGQGHENSYENTRNRKLLTSNDLEQTITIEILRNSTICIVLLLCIVLCVFAATFSIEILLIVEFIVENWKIKNWSKPFFQCSLACHHFHY